MKKNNKKIKMGVNREQTNTVNVVININDAITNAFPGYTPTRNVWNDFIAVQNSGLEEMYRVFERLADEVVDTDDFTLFTDIFTSIVTLYCIASQAGAPNSAERYKSLFNYSVIIGINVFGKSFTDFYEKYNKMYA